MSSRCGIRTFMYCMYDIYIYTYIYVYTNICTRLVVNLDIFLLTFRHAHAPMRNCRKPQKHGPAEHHWLAGETFSWRRHLIGWNFPEVESSEMPWKVMSYENPLVWVKFGEGFLAVDSEIDRPWKSEPWIWNNETTEVCQAWTASGQSVSWVGCAEAWIWKYLTRKCRQFSFLYLESPDVTSKPNFAELI